MGDGSPPAFLKKEQERKSKEARRTEGKGPVKNDTAYLEREKSAASEGEKNKKRKGIETRTCAGGGNESSPFQQRPTSVTVTKKGGPKKDSAKGKEKKGELCFCLPSACMCLGEATQEGRKGALGHLEKEKHL